MADEKRSARFEEFGGFRVYETTGGVAISGRFDAPIPELAPIGEELAADGFTVSRFGFRQAKGLNSALVKVDLGAVLVEHGSEVASAAAALGGKSLFDLIVHRIKKWIDDRPANDPDWREAGGYM